MKPIHKMLLLVTLLALAGSAWAVKKESDTGSGNNGGMQAPRQAMSDKDKWACEVAMCFSNPQGPTAVAECKPPIDKMRRELAKGRSIPRCPFVGNNSNSGGGSNTGGGGREEERPAQQIQ